MPPSVLIVSRSLDHQGGVVNLVRILLSHFQNPNVTHFVVGRTVSETGIAAAISPLRDNLRLALKLATSRVDVVHLNPSFNRTALLRDAILITTIRALSRARVLTFWHGWELDLSEQVEASLTSF